MRRLLLIGATAALCCGAGSAQVVDPRTAAEAAGELLGRPAPDIDTPAKIDPSRDPMVERPRSPRPRRAPAPRREEGAEAVTSAPAASSGGPGLAREASRPAPRKPKSVR